MLGGPVGLLGRAILDVLKRDAAMEYRTNGNCKQEFLKAFKILLVASLVFGMIFISSSNYLFDVVFGDKWHGAAEISMFLLPLFLLGLIASPLSFVFFLFERHRANLLWQIGLFIFTVASMIFFDSYEKALAVYGAGYAAFYVLNLFISYRISIGR